jgi:hypothetical protein
MKRALATALVLSLSIAQGAIAAPQATPSTEVATPSATLAASGSILVEKDEDGLSIDWSRFVLRIKGIGMAPERGPLAQRRLMAKRTALADGYRRLSDALDAIRVSSDAHLRDLTAVDDQARLGVNDLIREARTTDVHYWADGSVEVTLEVPLSGAQSLTSVIFGNAAAATGSVAPKTKPSGLVIDARGTGTQPALKAKVRDAAGKVIASDLPLAYYHLPEGAKEQAGDSPLKIKAKRAYGPTHADVLLTEEDANKVKAALKDGTKLPLAIIL